MSYFVTIAIAVVTSVASFVGAYKYLPLGALDAEPLFGSTITTIAGTDTLSASRSVINTNFSNLNTDKIQSGDTVSSLTITALTLGGVSGNRIVYSNSGGTHFAGVATSSLFGLVTANSLLANNTSASAVPAFVATSTLYGVGAYGRFLGMSGGSLQLLATTTFFAGTTGQFPYFSGTNTVTATSSLFMTTGGQVSTSAIQPATTTAIVLDWQASPNQVEYQIGTSATTITFINATTATMWGSRKLIQLWNPNGTAGAVTFAGAMFGSAYAQTTAAKKGDNVSCVVSRATSTPTAPTYVVLCSAGQASP